MSHEPSPLSEEHITAWARMVRATSGILQAIEGALKDAGLPPLGWYDALLETRRAGPDGIRPVKLQGELLIPQYNLSRLLDRMEKAGLVERLACDDDGRGQVVRITEAGRDMQRRMWRVYRPALEAAFAGRVREDEAQRLAGILSAFAAAAR